MKPRIYVGLSLDCTSRREIFKSAETPTEESHGKKYAAVIGPFRTMRGAEFMRDYGKGNPHCYTVQDAEKLAKKQGKTITPKYRIELDGNPMIWRDGKPTEKNLEKYVFAYAKSLEIGGSNAHISKALGYIPYPRKAQIVEQKTGEVKASWQAGMFQVY